MSAQGRGSAIVYGAALLMVLMLMSSDVAESATFKVGDSGGWTFNVVNWTRGKRFRVGDVLVFNYNPSYHNVVIVNDIVAYNNCSTPARSKTFTTGNDQIKLAKGRTNFICNFPSHCESNMKIAVIAT